MLSSLGFFWENGIFKLLKDGFVLKELLEWPPVDAVLDVAGSRHLLWLLQLGEPWQPLVWAGASKSHWDGAQLGMGKGAVCPHCFKIQGSAL